MAQQFIIDGKYLFGIFKVGDTIELAPGVNAILQDERNQSATFVINSKIVILSGDEETTFGICPYIYKISATSMTQTSLNYQIIRYDNFYPCFRVIHGRQYTNGLSD